jgi:Sulfotransferase family
MSTATEPSVIPSSHDSAIKVLYIMGWGRSGSTIMDNLLGGIDGFFSVGELSYLWERGLVEGRRCGCGRPVRECEVWSRVLLAGFGDALGDEVDPQRVVRWQRDAVRVRHTPGLIRYPRHAPTGRPALDSYVAVSARLLRATADVTGARVIVDSSKRPSDGALLRLVPGVDPYFVQLVRDPRAVAYSWRRRKAQPDRPRPADLVQHSAVDSTLSWLGWNAAAEALRLRHGRARSLLLRYEDFVERPRAALAAMTELVGEAGAAVPIEGERTGLLGSNHTVSGNPSRFRTGRVELRADDEWLTRQPAVDRLVATAVALPLLHRYGYALRPRAS